MTAPSQRRTPQAAPSVQLDAHAILGVSPGCEQAEIEEAFQNASAKYEKQLGAETWVRQAVRDAYRLLAETEVPRQAAAADNPTSNSQSAVGPLGFLSEALPLQNSTTYFILVNVLDIFMTYMLLAVGAMEANPIAAFFLDNWGFNGMIAFKLMLVAFVCVISQIVARKNMPYARGILWAGIGIVGAVVIYSIKLLVGQL